MPRRLRRTILGGVAGLVSLALVAGCTAAAADPTGAAADPNGVASRAGFPTATSTAATAPSPTPSATPPDPAKVKARLAKVARTGIGASGVVVLADDGTLITGRSAGRALAPASTMKVLTTLAAVGTLGADHRFTTKVVTAAKGRIVLVGGGDPLLTDKQSASASKPASLQALAAATADALAAAGVKEVSLGYDAGLFAGPDFHPDWKAKWRSWVARVSPLLIGSGRFNQWQSDPRPALTAAKAFAARLKKAGIRVTAVKAATAPLGASELAAVQSAPLSTIVARTLRLSDNLAADVLARHVAIATGGKASFTGAGSAVRSWLQGKGLWADGMRLVDGSGLSERSRVTPEVLAKAVVASLNTPELGSVGAGLPVAGKNGTLKDRFDDKVEKIARGNVHAKTGTLVGIASLTGYLTTKDGSRLVFAAMANRSVGQTTAYNWLDRSAATLVRCGCG